MEILNGHVDWQIGSGNFPEFHVEVNRIPSLEEMRFEKKGNNFFAELDGYCLFFFEDKKNNRGFGGREFHLKMKSGEEIILKGPWSSNVEHMELEGFRSSIGVRLKNKGYQSVHVREDILFDNFDRILPFDGECPKGYESIIEGKVGYDIVKKEIFVNCLNGSRFYKPDIFRY